MAAESRLGRHTVGSVDEKVSNDTGPSLEMASKPPLEPNIGVGEKRLILKIPDVWMFIPTVSGGAVKRIFPAFLSRRSLAGGSWA
jgi:hypothetical protein